jgi:hypothetical protein
LEDRARGRVDYQNNRTDNTHADSDATGMISDLVREAVTHFLNGCKQELQPEPEPTVPKRARKPAKAAKT